MRSNPIKVLHLSTNNEECGIAIYQQNIVDGMGQNHPVENEFFDISPNKLKLMSGTELDAAIDKLLHQLNGFDVLHIQHEYSFYNGNQLQRIVDGAKGVGKKVMFTLHTPPHAHRRGVSRRLRLTPHPRSWVNAKRAANGDKEFVTTYITPLMSADLLVTTSRASIESFASYGVDPSKMVVVELPVPKVKRGLSTTDITDNLQRRSGDIILSTAGFLSETKGIIPALKALVLLPSNYKLALIGGAHPSGQNDAFYDHVCDVMLDLGLRERVYITGYVQEDDRRDALIRETDICLYPYDRGYYDYVSSAALTNAIANDVPIVAYKTKTFIEMDDAEPFLNFSQSANYYELARTVRSVDIAESIKRTKHYAEKFSVEKQAAKFAELYQQLTA